MAVKNEGWSLHVVAGDEWESDVLWSRSVMACSVGREYPTRANIINLFIFTYLIIKNISSHQIPVAFRS